MITEQQYDLAIEKANKEIMDFVNKNPNYKTQDKFYEIRERQLKEVSRIQQENKDFNNLLIHRKI